MTLAIDLTPAEEARLTAAAVQEGLDLSALAKRRVMADPVPSESAAPPDASQEDPDAEYLTLVNLELAGPLTEEQAARLRRVEQRLHEEAARNPAVQALYQFLDGSDVKWDRVMALLESYVRTAEAK